MALEGQPKSETPAGYPAKDGNELGRSHEYLDVRGKVAQPENRKEAQSFMGSRMCSYRSGEME